MPPHAPQIVVAGVSGFVGHAAARQFAQSGCPVIGLSRSPPHAAIAGVTVLHTDFRDPASCRAIAPQLSAATHLVYAAVNETPGDLVASWSDPAHAARNGAMFANLLDAMLAHAPNLHHVTLIPAEPLPHRARRTPAATNLGPL
jgi:nucleoside-diphosphate-sugar epimerase